MKKLFKIPTLLIALMLILTSCGRSAEDDAKTIADVKDLMEKMQDAKKAKGTKQIAL